MFAQNMMSVGTESVLTNNDSIQFNYTDNLTKGVSDLQQMALNVNKLDRVKGADKNEWIQD